MTDQERWILRDDAAKYLGVHPRELQRKAKRYPLQIRERRTGHSEPALYAESDLIGFRQRQKQGFDAQTYERQLAGEQPAGAVIEAAVVPRAGAAEVAQAQVEAFKGLADFAMQLAQLATKGAPPAVLSGGDGKPARPWLTIEEAAEYSGLPASWLRQKCSDGSIGRNVGIGVRPRYRINRQELEQLP